MNPKTNIISHKNYHYDFNNSDFANPKPNIRTQVPNHNKSPNKTSMISPTSKQPFKPKENKTKFPPINPEPNKFPNIKNEINNPFYKSPGVGMPKTEIKRDKMDIVDEYKKNMGTSINAKKNNKMDFDDEYKKNMGTAINAKKNNNINKDNLPDKKTGKAKAFTTINKNKKDFVHEKNKNIENPKTEIKKNRINPDITPKINQNKNKNQVEKETEINNLYINSINDVRLPKELVDISFEGLKAE